MLLQCVESETFGYILLNDYAEHYYRYRVRDRCCCHRCFRYPIGFPEKENKYGNCLRFATGQYHRSEKVNDSLLLKSFSYIYLSVINLIRH